MSEHAVIITVRGDPLDFDALELLEEALEESLSASGVGEFDGVSRAVDGTNMAYFTYGSDGDRLYSLIRPFFVDHPAVPNAEVYIRYGAVDDTRAKEARFNLRDAQP